MGIVCHVIFMIILLTFEVSILLSYAYSLDLLLFCQLYLDDYFILFMGFLSCLFFPSLYLQFYLFENNAILFIDFTLMDFFW